MRWKLALAALLFPFSGFAQSVPNGGNITQGTVWTPAQWDIAWASKLDLTAGGGGGGSSSNFNATFPATGTAIGGNNGGNMVYVGVDSFHDLLVNLATALPSGANTIGAVAQAGTWTVGLSGTIGLPAGAATAANQSAVFGSVNGGLAGGNSLLVGGVFNSAPLTLGNTQQAAVQLDANGFLKVNIAAGSAAGGTSSSFGSTFPGSGTAIGAKNGGNMVAVAADASNNLDVNLQTALPAGANVIGGVTQSGTWNVSQATAASLNATVVGAGTAGTANAGVVTVQGIASMTPVQVSQATAASLNATVSQATGTNLHIVCDTGCSSSTAPADEAAFTFGTTSQTPIGGVYQTTATSNPLTTGQMGAMQLTINRALMTNLRNAVGVEVGVAATPLQVSIANTAVNGTAIVTTSTLNQSAAVLSATNGLYTNILQGNAALTTGNPIFAQTTSGSVTAATQSGTWTNTVTQATGSNLHIVCDSGCSSSTAPADESAFTAGTTSQTPVGGFFQTSATSNPLTNGQMGAIQLTANRAVFSNLRNASGTEIGTAGNPIQVSLANTASNGTAVSVSLAANQTVNEAQINGVTPLMGNGVSGTGSQRVNIASDNTAFAVNAAATATEVHSGEVGGNQIKVQVAQTVTASGYTAGNAVGGLMTIASAARVSGSLGASGTGGILQNVAMNSKSTQTTQVDVFIFDASPSGSTCTDKTAFVLAAADFDKVIGVAHITDWTAGNVASLGQASNLAMAFNLSSATSIFACAVTRATPTFASTSDISFKYEILRD